LWGDKNASPFLFRPDSGVFTLSTTASTLQARILSIAFGLHARQCEALKVLVVAQLGTYLACAAGLTLSSG
jgi:hypothetical protein